MTDHVQLASTPQLTRAAFTRAGGRDFDFLLGRWRVRNRRRLRPLTGSDEWEEFDATSVVRSLWGGHGNIEEWDAVTPRNVIRALSLHLYDQATGQWRLHWATDRDGRVGPPTTGSFRNRIGEFYAQEDFSGRAILLRIVWEDRGPHACGWEQSFSEDGGRTWESNWTMAFTRVP